MLPCLHLGTIPLVSYLKPIIMTKELARVRIGITGSKPVLSPDVRSTFLLWRFSSSSIDVSAARAAGTKIWPICLSNLDEITWRSQQASSETGLGFGFWKTTNEKSQWEDVCCMLQPDIGITFYVQKRFSLQHFISHIVTFHFSHYS